MYHRNIARILYQRNSYYKSGHGWNQFTAQWSWNQTKSCMTDTDSYLVEENKEGRQANSRGKSNFRDNKNNWIHRSRQVVYAVTENRRTWLNCKYRKFKCGNDSVADNVANNRTEIENHSQIVGNNLDKDLN